MHRTNAEAQTSPVSGSLTQPLKVIVADDNRDVLLTLRMWLEADGCVVQTFASGEHLVDAVREFQPDVCILDIGMPIASGYAVAGQIRAAYGSQRPLMIAISGTWCRAPDRLLAMSCGFDHFLEKPADPRHLSRILEDLKRSRGAALRPVGGNA